MTRITSIKAFLAQKGDAAPTQAERAFIDAIRAGQPCTLGDGTRPETEIPERRIRAALLRVMILGGYDDCRTAEAGVMLEGAFIPDTLDLDFCKASGGTVLRDCHFSQKISALQAELQIFDMSGSRMPGLFAHGIAVKGDVFLRKGFHATGEVSLAGARIGGQLVCRKGRFENALGKALNAQGAEVTGDVFLSKSFHATDEVSLSNARIGGHLVCSRGRFENAKGKALNAQGVEVTGGVFLSGDLSGDFHATGEVSLSGARIRGPLECSKGRFENTIADGAAFVAQRMRVEGSLFWRDVRVDEGSVSFTSAHVGDLVDDLASWPEGPDRLALDGFTYDRIVGSFTDAPTRLKWLKRGAFWNGGFQPQPYVHLAKTLRSMGHERDARLVMIEHGKLLRQYGHKLIRKDLRDTPRAFHRKVGVWLKIVALPVWNSFENWFVGYGYAPIRSLGWLLGLFLIANTLAYFTWREGSFAPNSDVILTSQGWKALVVWDCVPEGLIGPCLQKPAAEWSSFGQDGLDWDTFHPVGYAADLVIPILDLGQTDAWAPSKDRGTLGTVLWFGRWVLAALGWLVSGLGIAAVTGLMQRKTDGT